jgi:hypothetical protein
MPKNNPNANDPHFVEGDSKTGGLLNPASVLFNRCERTSLAFFRGVLTSVCEAESMACFRGRPGFRSLLRKLNLQCLK